MYKTPPFFWCSIFGQKSASYTRDSTINFHWRVSTERHDLFFSNMILQAIVQSQVYLPCGLRSNVGTRFRFKSSAVCRDSSSRGNSFTGCTAKSQIYHVDEQEICSWQRTPHCVDPRTRSNSLRGSPIERERERDMKCPSESSDQKA